MPYADIEKQREYQRKWIAKRRQDYLSDKSCRCGSNEGLEIHHIDPKIKISHRIWSLSKEKRTTELNKCIVLCESCHKEETKKWYKENLKHGSKTLAESGCACEDCSNYRENKYQSRVDRYYLTGK